MYCARCGKKFGPFDGINHFPPTKIYETPKFYCNRCYRQILAEKKGTKGKTTEKTTEINSISPSKRKISATTKRKIAVILFSLLIIIPFIYAVGMYALTIQEDELGWNQEWIYIVAKSEILERIEINFNWYTFDYKEIHYKEIQRGHDVYGEYIEYEVWGVIYFAQSPSPYEPSIRGSFTVDMKCYKFDDYRTISVDIT